MDDDELDETPFLVITSAEKVGCRIYFEPWVSEHFLPYGVRLLVRTPGLHTGDVEVSYVDSGVIVCFTSNDEVVVTNKSGEKIPKYDDDFLLVRGTLLPIGQVCE